MLARRLIPCLDVAGGRVVKGVRFQDLRDAGDPVEQASRYDAEGADELVFLDISASHEARATLLDVVSRVAERLFVSRRTVATHVEHLLQKLGQTNRVELTADAVNARPSGYTSSTLTVKSVSFASDETYSVGTIGPLTSVPSLNASLV